ncbi:MAG: hypothetical protein U1D97_12420 [Desulfuromonadales bacterium]|nr:hypothetical protein [Desulfuromonadales bacterium]
MKKTPTPDSQSAFDFERLIDEYSEIKADLHSAAAEAGERYPGTHNELEDCIEIAAAIKRTVRDCGMSREQLVDAINEYFGRSEEGAKAEPPTCRPPLSIHMLNNYLSKPCEYPIPAYFLFALHAITGIIEPGATIISAAGGQVISAEEIKLLQLGKLEQTLNEIHKLRREMRNGRHR